MYEFSWGLSATALSENSLPSEKQKQKGKVDAKKKKKSIYCSICRWWYMRLRQWNFNEDKTLLEQG